MVTNLTPSESFAQPPFRSFHPCLQCWALLSLRSQSVPSEFLTTPAHPVVMGSLLHVLILPSPPSNLQWF